MERKYRRALSSFVLPVAMIGVLADALRRVDAAAAAPVPEERVKAAFLYKFTAYVDWPQDARPAPGAPFVIAVAGADALAAELREVVAGRTALDRPITIRRVLPGEPLFGVQVLFVGRDQDDRLEDLVPRAQRRSILIVTESDGALVAGSVINFKVAEQRVRFEVSLESAGRCGLRVSSRLLDVAERVVPEAD